MNSRCCLGLMTKKQKVPHKSVWITRKVPHKNVINLAISLFFSILQQEYNNNTMSMKEMVSHRSLFDDLSV